LKEVQYHADNDDSRDNRRIGSLSHYRRHHACNQQNQDEWIYAEMQKLQKRPGMTRRRRFVRPISEQTTGGV
jgi:hypothetical protein